MWKILIIDDDFQVLEGMKKSIPWEALEAEWVGEASDGQEGLEQVKLTKPDIIISDIYMPVMNGLEMIERLREENFPGELIILSGYADFQYARQALRLQVSDYLSKPVTVEELHKVLDKVIKELEAKELAKHEQAEVKRRLMMYEPFVQKEWLKAIVTGTYDLEMAEDHILLSEQAYWLERNHVVMGIELMSTVRTSNLSLTDWNLFRFALANIIWEILAEDWPESEFIELHSHHAAIMFHFSCSLTEAEALQKLELIGRRITACVDTYLQLTIRLGLGSIKQCWKNLPDSTEEAFLDLLQQTVVSEKGTPSLATVKQAFTHRPIKFYQELAEAIVYANKQTAEHIIEDYMKQLHLMPAVTPAYLQYLCTELWTIFAYSLYNAGIVLDELFPDSTMSPEIDQILTLEQLHQWLVLKIDVITSSRHWYENSKHKEAVDFMIHYAHERYAEEINLEDMSKQLYLSRNYLNQIFKKATGETFINYLIHVRMKKAKALLLEGKHMIYEIAEMVGYKNVPYFSSIFKKYNGINPSEMGRR